MHYSPVCHPNNIFSLWPFQLKWVFFPSFLKEVKHSLALQRWCFNTSNQGCQSLLNCTDSSFVWYFNSVQSCGCYASLQKNKQIQDSKLAEKAYEKYVLLIWSTHQKTDFQCWGLNLVKSLCHTHDLLWSDPAIHFLPLIKFRVTGGLDSIPAIMGRDAGEDPRQVASLLQGWHRETDNHLRSWTI